jgi:hypothetical protein
VQPYGKAVWNGSVCPVGNISTAVRKRTAGPQLHFDPNLN